MLSLAVLICALLGANAEIPTWDASCVGCPLNSLAEHKVESADGFLATTLTVDVITLKTPNTTFKTRAYNGALGGPRLVLQAATGSSSRLSTTWKTNGPGEGSVP